MSKNRMLLGSTACGLLGVLAVCAVAYFRAAGGGSFVFDGNLLKDAVLTFVACAIGGFIGLSLWEEKEKEKKRKEGRYRRGRGSSVSP